MTYSNGNSFGESASCMPAVESLRVRSLPWVFRVRVPGFEGGWPA